MTMRDLIGSCARALIMGTSLIIATLSAANVIDVKAIDGNEPENFPSYETHAAAGQVVCKATTGDATIVRSGNDVVAAHVIVVKMNGKIVRMDTTEAWHRSRTTKTADNIWVVGVCKADTINPTTRKA